jgi:hypothetical protein
LFVLHSRAGGVPRGRHFGEEISIEPLIITNN